MNRMEVLISSSDLFNQMMDLEVPQYFKIEWVHSRKAIRVWADHPFNTAEVGACIYVTTDELADANCVFSNSWQSQELEACVSSIVDQLTREYDE